MIRALHAMQEAGEDESTLTKAVTDIFSSQFAKILGVSEEVEPGKALLTYGLDSLSALELRKGTRQKRSVELSTLDIIDATSLTKFSGKVVGKLPEVEQISWLLNCRMGFETCDMVFIRYYFRLIYFTSPMAFFRDQEFRRT